MQTIPNASEIRNNPSLLTHSADPSKRQLHSSIRYSVDSSSALACFDGKVGALVNVGSQNYIVTSPNSDCVYIPPLGERSVRMRDLDWCHFGEDDPMLYPQLYAPEVGFLAVIPTIIISFTSHTYL